MAFLHILVQKNMLNNIQNRGKINKMNLCIFCVKKLLKLHKVKIYAFLFLFFSPPPFQDNHQGLLICFTLFLSHFSIQGLPAVHQPLAKFDASCSAYIHLRPFSSPFTITCSSPLTNLVLPSTLSG
jgi:hypothetical protein